MRLPVAASTAHLPLRPDDVTVDHGSQHVGTNVGHPREDARPAALHEELRLQRLEASQRCVHLGRGGRLALAAAQIGIAGLPQRWGASSVIVSCSVLTPFSMNWR